MLLRFDPFRDFDRLTNEVFGAARTPALMPMDCLRTDDRVLVRFDLPGIDTDSLEVTAENQTLTVKAERRRKDPQGATYLVSERPSGSYSRQLVLGDGLNTDEIKAEYRDGVLTLTIPVSERAKSRRIEITRGGQESIGSHEGHKMISGESSGSGARDRETASVGA
jgi:HSP20 family protein